MPHPPNPLRSTWEIHRQEYLLIERYFSLTPREREKLYPTLSVDERLVIRDAQAGGGVLGDVETRGWSTLVSSEKLRCHGNACRRLARWIHKDGNLSCNACLEE